MQIFLFIWTIARNLSKLGFQRLHTRHRRARTVRDTHARTYARSAVTLLTAALPVGLKQSGHCNAFCLSLFLPFALPLFRSLTHGHTWRVRPHSNTCSHVTSLLNYTVKYVEPSNLGTQRARLVENQCAQNESGAQKRIRDMQRVWGRFSPPSFNNTWFIVAGMGKGGQSWTLKTYHPGNCVKGAVGSRSS